MWCCIAHLLHTQKEPYSAIRNIFQKYPEFWWWMKPMLERILGFPFQNQIILFISFCIQKKYYCKVNMVSPEVCPCPLFKNNAICEHTLKLASEATACRCPLILSTIGVFSPFHFEQCTLLNPLSGPLRLYCHLLDLLSIPTPVTVPVAWKFRDACTESWSILTKLDT